MNLLLFISVSVFRAQVPITARGRKQEVGDQCPPPPPPICFHKGKNMATNKEQNKRKGKKCGTT